MASDRKTEKKRDSRVTDRERLRRKEGEREQQRDNHSGPFLKKHT